MKVIFLDIDGVLNPVHYMNCMGKMRSASFGEIKSMDDYGHMFFQHNVNALTQIISQTDAKIVISSTWRLSGLNIMREMWSARSLPGDIIDVTPREQEIVQSGEAQFYDMVCRGTEIACWIKKNCFEGNYVIIDDTTDMLKEQEPYFVKTNEYIGLTYKDAAKAIEILNK